MASGSDEALKSAGSVLSGTDAYCLRVCRAMFFSCRDS